MTSNDLLCLQPQEFLNDIIIDFYLKLVQLPVFLDVYQNVCVCGGGGGACVCVCVCACVCQFSANCNSYRVPGVFLCLSVTVELPQQIDHVCVFEPGRENDRVCVTVGREGVCARTCVCLYACMDVCIELVSECCCVLKKNR